MSKRLAPQVLCPLAVVALFLLVQFGCGGPPENVVVEPPEDFKVVPIEDSRSYGSAMSDSMDPEK